ncbi:glyoxalase [Phragmitibacter flavus]|uniref:Glyoxalase n=1 Tax=Phragmitibacter flavus TaxID=2576071 RepID=A0A5R8KG24_9BACT|nr:VOC family protein [Phragmitibacter flavus]TLD71258.1 glyoxalase [Phragmitibacter flavus]
MSTTIIPCLAYRNAAQAIEWLCDIFGFEKHAVYPNEDGSIAHAELKLGNSMIMLGDINDGPFGRYITQPADINGKETQCCYLVVSDADLIHEKVIASGCEILIPIKDESYGGRGFTCRDLEGHIWSLGTYNPWTSKS